MIIHLLECTTPINLRRAADMCRNVQPEIRQGEELPQHMPLYTLLVVIMS